MKEYKFWKKVGNVYFTIDKNNVFEIMRSGNGCSAKVLLKIKLGI